MVQSTAIGINIWVVGEHGLQRETLTGTSKYAGGLCNKMFLKHSECTLIMTMDIVVVWLVGMDYQQQHSKQHIQIISGREVFVFPRVLNSNSYFWQVNWKIALEYLLWGKHLLFCFLACPDHFSCLNGGTCIDGTCSCPSGFSGLKCHIGNDLNMRIRLIHYNHVKYFFVILEIIIGDH